MAISIELPQVGESVVEGTIGKWLKQPGDVLKKYDPLVEVVTDKVTMEVPGPLLRRPDQHPGPGGGDHPGWHRHS